jgi:ketosteroid isomerase-like protein
MFRTRTVALVGTLLALVGVTAANAALASTDAPDASAGVRALIERTNEVMRNHGSLEEFQETLFEEDVMLTGEGDKTFYRSRKEFESTLAQYVKGQFRCRLTVVDPVRSSGIMAAAFVQMHCDPEKAGDPPVESRILYVFRHGERGWRVMMEMYSAGRLE